MSRAGKFIPGGSNKAKRTGPIRAAELTPDGGTPVAEGGEKKKLLTVGGINKKISKQQKWPIYALSGFVLCLLCSVAWYEFGYLPMKKTADDARKAYEDQKAADERAAAAAATAAKVATDAANAAKCIFSVTTNPPGASVRVADTSTTTPAKIDNLVAGSYTVAIKMDGYEDVQTNIVAAVDKPVDLGTINLDQKVGDLVLASPQSDVTYTLTGPNSYSHQGNIPDKVTELSVGDYTLTVAQKGWGLPSMPITIADHVTTTKDVKFPYGKVTITSTPPGATVRQGRNVLGMTSDKGLTLPPTRPGELHLSVDLPPRTIQTIDIRVTDFADLSKNVRLEQGKDFISASGMPMVWIADGGYWAGKYLVRQRDLEKVAPGSNQSFFRGANLPVDSISWDGTQDFIGKLNDYEGKAGKLPGGFHYSLPSESQWEQFNADTDITTAAISSNTPLNSTQDVGYSAPNKYGLYDTIGNVWEWCLDADAKGNHSMRGGTWLSLPNNFPNASARSVAVPKDAEKLIGFRVVLVPAT